MTSHKLITRKILLSDIKYFDKSDETIDKNVLFCNFEYAKFKKIYETRYELDVRFANDLQ